MLISGKHLSGLFSVLQKIIILLKNLNHHATRRICRLTSQSWNIENWCNLWFEGFLIFLDLLGPFDSSVILLLKFC